MRAMAAGLEQCGDGGLHLTREEIAQSALDYISSNIDIYILASLERLVVAGRIVEDRDATRGRPYIYSMPKIQRSPIS
jgi:hypothetical protein